MTRAVSLSLAAVALILRGVLWITSGVIFSATVWATHTPETMQRAQIICANNGGNFLMELQGVPKEMKGWRCYSFTHANADPQWIGPDILARRYLEHENKSGWEVWEDVDES